MKCNITSLTLICPFLASLPVHPQSEGEERLPLVSGSPLRRDLQLQERSWRPSLRHRCSECSGELFLVWTLAFYSFNALKVHTVKPVLTTTFKQRSPVSNNKPDPHKTKSKTNF
jgi:hypothetical protein